jgi:hypothetical protein
MYLCKNIINYPQHIFMSNQSYWKDITNINNFHVYNKDQFKTETYEQNAKT